MKEGTSGERRDHYEEDIRALNFEINELKKLLIEANEERHELHHAVKRWEDRVDALIEAIKA